LKIQEKPEEELSAVRFQQNFDLSELQAVLDAKQSMEEEYHQISHDDDEAQSIVKEMNAADWEEFFAPIELVRLN
jgi:hypothetical protein